MISSHSSGLHNPAVNSPSRRSPHYDTLGKDVQAKIGAAFRDITEVHCAYRRQSSASGASTDSGRKSENSGQARKTAHDTWAAAWQLCPSNADWNGIREIYRRHHDEPLLRKFISDMNVVANLVNALEAPPASLGVSIKQRHELQMQARSIRMKSNEVLAEVHKLLRGVKWRGNSTSQHVHNQLPGELTAATQPLVRPLIRAASAIPSSSTTLAFFGKPKTAGQRAFNLLLEHSKIPALIERKKCTSQEVFSHIDESSLKRDWKECEAINEDTRCDFGDFSKYIGGALFSEHDRILTDPDPAKRRAELLETLGKFSSFLDTLGTSNLLHINSAKRANFHSWRK